MITIKTAEEFLERVKNKQSVSRFEFELGFKWETKESKLLRGADLQGADLQGANLREANLRGADLQGANLREADLWGADLQEADLQEADLQGANLWRANLWGAKGTFIFNFGAKLKVVSDKE